MKRLQYIIWCSLLLLVASCEKDTEPTSFVPAVTTGSAEDLDKPGIDITLSGEVATNPQSTIQNEIGFLIATSEEIITSGSEKAIKATASSNTGNKYLCDLKEMSPGTYYFCIYASSGYSVKRGEIVSFSITEKTPRLNMGSIADKDLTASSMKVSATITDKRGFDILGRGFCWSAETAEPSVNGNKVEVKETTDAFSALIEGLEPEKRYYIRAYALNEKGIGYSNTIECTTPVKQTVSLSIPDYSDLDVSSVHIKSIITAAADFNIIEKGACYSKTVTSPTINDTSAKDKSEGNAVDLTVTGLEEGATYYISAYARTRDGVFYSTSITVKTQQTFKPTLGNLQEVQVNDDNAIIKASVTDNGGLAITKKGFCWSTSNSEPTIDNDSVVSSATGNDFEAVLTQLKYNTEYYVRAYAINSKGVGYSSAFIKIKTGSSTIATTEDISASNPTPSTLDVSATITADGGAKIDERGFVYSHTGTPTVEENEGIIKIDGTTGEMSATMTGLIGYTTYYIRAYAHNKNGYAYSHSTTARTKKADPSIDDPAFPDTRTIKKK
ncbi:fibronectin type III domain-containing protein [Bacteroides timonensis]|uniref:hypothetical protein n=1 Tax=Bacteroides timonensis TaxID=1470345 RepID=UPI0004B17FB8|nr:hypothetical protein [Bacteroides timonensis]